MIEQSDDILTEPIDPKSAAGKRGRAVPIAVIAQHTVMFREHGHLRVPHGKVGAQRIRQRQDRRFVLAIQTIVNLAAFHRCEWHVSILVQPSRSRLGYSDGISRFVGRAFRHGIEATFPSGVLTPEGPQPGFPAACQRSKKTVSSSPPKMTFHSSTAPSPETLFATNVARRSLSISRRTGSSAFAGSSGK